MVDEIEVSENKEALIVLAGTVAGAATTFVASLLQETLIVFLEGQIIL